MENDVLDFKQRKMNNLQKIVCRLSHSRREYSPAETHRSRLTRHAVRYASIITGGIPDGMPDCVDVFLSTER
jgi:uncharacterized membrane protein YccC